MNAKKNDQRILEQLDLLQNMKIYHYEYDKQIKKITWNISGII